MECPRTESNRDGFLHSANGSFNTLKLDGLSQNDLGVFFVVPLQSWFMGGEKVKNHPYPFRGSRVGRIFVELPCF